MMSTKQVKGNWFKLGLLASACGGLLLRYWGTRWGATTAEVHAPLPGDNVIPHPMLETSHAITIHAAAERVWPWLVQMGYDRGGWYTDRDWGQWWWELGDALKDKYLRWITRVEIAEAGSVKPTIPSANRIVPELQDLKLGDTILDGPPGTAFFTVTALEPNHLLVLHSDTHLRFLFPPSIRNNPKTSIGGEFSWVFILNEIDKVSTRLILRTRANIEPRVYRAFAKTFFPIADLLIVPKMLKAIKERTERVP